ncbi:MAG: hypothetical protein ABI016_07810 [Chthoniobacterales bacterium]
MKILAASFLVLLVASAFASRDDFDRAMTDANKARESSDGRKYSSVLADTMNSIYATGIRCVPMPPTRDSYFTIVFYIAADGSVERILEWTPSPTTRCFAQVLKGKKFPHPPRAHWPVSFGIGAGDIKKN